MQPLRKTVSSHQAIGESKGTVPVVLVVDDTQANIGNNVPRSVSCMVVAPGHIPLEVCMKLSVVPVVQFAVLELKTLERHPRSDGWCKPFAD